MSFSDKLRMMFFAIARTIVNDNVIAIARKVVIATKVVFTRNICFTSVIVGW